MTDTTTGSRTGISPTPMPDGLRRRMLGAMQQASNETHEDFEQECKLKRLYPASIPDKLKATCHRHMRQAQQASLHHPYPTRIWWRAAAVACVAIAGVCGIGSSVLSALGADDAQGLAHRSVLERTGGETVKWAANGVPMRQYEVMYEDSFVLAGEDDTTLVIRVPNRTTISVKGEVI